MEDEPLNSAEIKPTDIIFDCPYCSKSLAIDYRGAGLTVPCTDCGRYVQVPIPDGMEIEDVNGSDEELEMRLQNTRRALAAAQRRIQDLETEVADLRARCEMFEKSRADSDSQAGTIQEKVDVVQKALRDIVDLTGHKAAPGKVV
jgi:transcription elongation factor Elf1